MNPALLVSKTGLQAQDAKLQVIAHNLANVNTVGFKRNSAAFEDQFYEITRMPGSNSQGDNRVPAGVQLGTGVRLVSTHKQFTEGSMQNTSQQLDVAIVGNGFLQVLQANGETAYTRAGQLQVDNEGRLVNANGLPLQPEITIPEGAKSVTISETGLVSAMVGTDATAQELGTLQLATLLVPDGGCWAMVGPAPSQNHSASRYAPACSSRGRGFQRRLTQSFPGHALRARPSCATRPRACGKCA